MSIQRRGRTFFCPKKTKRKIIKGKWRTSDCGDLKTDSPLCQRRNHFFRELKGRRLPFVFCFCCCCRLFVVARSFFVSNHLLGRNFGAAIKFTFPFSSQRRTFHARSTENPVKLGKLVLFSFLFFLHTTSENRAMAAKRQDEWKCAQINPTRRKHCPRLKKKPGKTR